MTVDNITKEQFMAYEKVRREGKYNMIMESVDAMAAAGLTRDQYFAIIVNYTELARKFDVL